MPFRHHLLRVVDRSGTDTGAVRTPFSLLWAALAAADETVQGGIMTSSFLGLFLNHLSAADTSNLRWRGDMAASAELRRAYSALYGRFFARAVMEQRSVTNFISLGRNGVAIPGGATVTRNKKGDIPDWIAWDAAAGSYVLVEAKGRLTGNEQLFRTGQPTCVADGKKQFGRVTVTAAGHLVGTPQWVVANRWVTDDRKGNPVCLVQDPPRDGTSLTPDERPQHARAINAARNKILTDRLGWPTRDTASSSTDGFFKLSVTPEQESIKRRDKARRYDGTSHSGVYAIAAFSAFGVRPILSPEDLGWLNKSRRTAPDETLIFGLAKKTLLENEERGTWLSGSGLAMSDGLSLFKLGACAIEPEPPPAEELAV